MKTSLASILLLLGFAVAADLRGAPPAPPFLWARPVEGGSLIPFEGVDSKGKPYVVKRTGSMALSVAVDGAGNAYLAGYFYGTAILGSTTLTNAGRNPSAFVAKLDSGGKFLWATQVKPAADLAMSVTRSVAVDGVGNIYLAGSFRESSTFGITNLTTRMRPNSEDLFVAKLDANGSFLWTTQVGGLGQCFSKSVAVDPAGNSYVAGSFSGTLDAATDTAGGTTLTNRGKLDGVVVKLGPNGNVLWATQAGGSDMDMVNSVAVDGAGNTYATGLFTGRAAFGATTLISQGHYETFVAKLDISGNYLWARQAVGNNTNIAHGLAVDGAGNTYLTGGCRGTTKFGAMTITHDNSMGTFVTKLDADGNFLWTRAASAGGGSAGRSVTLDRAGNIYLAGAFRRSVTFGTTTLAGHADTGIFVTKMDAKGNFLWAKQAGGGGGDAAHSVKVDNESNVYVAGALNYMSQPIVGTAVFDAKSLTVEATHAYVAKIAAQPTGMGIVATSNPGLRVLVPQRLHPPQRGFSGQFQLLFGNQDGSVAQDSTHFEVHYTTNLAGANTVWVTNSSSLQITNGMILFEDPDSPGAVRRFYRVIEK